MFADSSGDCVPMMYLTYLQDLDNPRLYNWGSAVLACMYRQLCCASLIKTKGIAGPIVLLQQWSWTRLLVCRPHPRVKGWSPDWGVPDSLTCPAYGAKWLIPTRMMTLFLVLTLGRSLRHPPLRRWLIQTRTMILFLVLTLGRSNFN